MPPVISAPSPSASAVTCANSETDVFLLTFPSLPSLASTAYCTALTALARSSKSLLIVVRTLEPFLDSPEAYATARQEGKGKEMLNDEVKGEEDNGFDVIESVLVELYTRVMGVYIQEDRPLDKVDVVVEGMRGKQPFIEMNDEGRWKSITAFHVDEPVDSIPVQSIVQQANKIPASVKVTALGGTFDHLHVGHKILLTLSAWITTERLIVGISDDVLLQRKKFPQHLETLVQRQATVRNFLTLIKPSLQFDLPPLQDVYGPTSVDPKIQAIVVSEETRSGGEAVNAERKRNGLSQLRINVINLMPSSPGPSPNLRLRGRSTADDIAIKMGSTAIREWIDRRQQQRQE